MNFHGTKILLLMVSVISGHRTEKLFSMGIESLALVVVTKILSFFWC